MSDKFVVSDDDLTVDDAKAKASDLGESHGKSAASWTIDGNTSSDAIARIVKMIDDGDPALYDEFREPSFSGEFAGDYSERDLCRDLGISYDLSETAEIDEVVDAWLESAQSAFWTEVERLYKQAL